MNYLDPEKQLNVGIHHKKWISKEEVLKEFPNQNECSKREDVELIQLLERVIFHRIDAIILEKSIPVDLLTDVIHYLTMRCEVI